MKTILKISLLLALVLILIIPLSACNPKPAPAGVSFGATGRTTTKVVAASNASPTSKAQADYVCDGTGDNVEIQAAITAASALGGGKVFLTEGTFSTNVTINCSSNVTIEGAGRDATIISSAVAGKAILAEEKVNVRLDHFQVNGNQTALVSGAANICVWSSNYTRIEDVYSYSAKEDSLFIGKGGSGVVPFGTTVIGFKGNNSSRSGIAISSGNNTLVQNFELWGNDKHETVASFDIEPNSSADVLCKLTLRDGDIHDDTIQGLGVHCAYNSTVQRDFLFDNVRVYKCGSDGAVFSGNNFVQIINCKFYSNAGSGTYFSRDNRYFDIENCDFFLNSVRGMALVTASENETTTRFFISNSRFYNNSQSSLGTYAGLHVDYTSQAIANVFITDCFFGGYAPNALQGYGIIDVKGAITYITDCLFSGNTVASTSGIAKHTVLHHIPYDPVESSGTGIIGSGASSVAVSHGLQFTPVAGDIIVWPLTSLGSASYLYVDTYTSSAFTVHTNTNPVSVNVTFGWATAPKGN